MSQLLRELQRKFKTPQDAIRALGLDAKLLQEPQGKRKPAQDAGLTEIATALAAVAPMLPDANPVPGGLAPAVAPAIAAPLAPMGAVPPEVVDPALTDPMALPPVTDPVVAAAPAVTAPAMEPDTDVDGHADPVDPDPVDPDDPDKKSEDAADAESWLRANYPDIYDEFQAHASGTEEAPPEVKSDDTAKAEEDKDEEDNPFVAKDEDDEDDEDKFPFAKDEDDDEDEDDDTAKDRVRGGANRARGKRGITRDNDLPPANTKGPAMQPPDIKRPVSKAAMDAAIRDATLRERQNQRAIQQAQREVRPWVGEFGAGVAFDSAPQVYKKALDVLGVPTKDLHRSAYAPVLRAQPRPGLKQVAARRPAQDAAPEGGSLADRFPGTANTMVG
jgi:hypothetical protein